MPARSHLLIYAQLFFGMAFFGTGTPSAKVVADAFPLFLTGALRLGVAALALAPLLFLHRDRLSHIARRDWIEIAIIGGVGIVAFTLFLMTGMQRVNGVIGAVIMALSLAAMAVASFLFMGNALGWRKIAAVVLAVAGVVVINVSGESIEASGWTLVLGSLMVFLAVCSQTAYSLVGKRVMMDLSPMVVLPLAVLIAFALFLGPGLWQARSFNFGAPDLNAWIGIVVWGLGPLAIGTLIWFHGLHQVSGSIASGFMGAMPASALILSYVWLGDAFHYVHLVGFALVFVSIALISWAHRIEEKQQSGNEQADGDA